MCDAEEDQPATKRLRLEPTIKNEYHPVHTNNLGFLNSLNIPKHLEADSSYPNSDCQPLANYTGIYPNMPSEGWPLPELHQSFVCRFERLPNNEIPPEDTLPYEPNLPPDGDKEMMVCFGVITGLAVHLDSSNRFASKEYPFFRGRIPTEHAQLLEGMMDEQTLDLRIICTIDARPARKKKGRTYMMWPCTLDITIHGPFELFDELGNWLQDYEVHLQDPRVCHLDTKYCNPQRLSSVRPWPLVSEIVSRRLFLSPREIPESSEFLDILSSHIDLEETPQPLAIRTSLKSYQKQALTFMLDRERGWGFNRGHADIWEILDTGSGRVFLNTISRHCQAEEPISFLGGIIADPMGFGKTLTMISLVATDRDTVEMAGICMDDLETRKPETAATLVIIPPPLIGTWEDQLLDHVVEGELVCRRHHGKNRIMEPHEIDSVHIVLTTYHTVSADWKADQETGGSPIFAVRWKRIILDLLAHFIRNGSTRMARAVCDLEATSRWAVTGTPIQNRLGDLASLLKFIRAYPYTDPKQFDADVSRPWKSGEDEDAVKRLKRLSACLLLRRPKTAVDLPPRRDLVYEVDFTLEERETYNKIRHQTITNIDEAFENNSSPSGSHIYVNVLQQIESLRLFSNLGLHYLSRHTKLSPKSEITSIFCAQCSSALGLTETLLDDTTHPTKSAQFTSCLQFGCTECASKNRLSGKVVSCGHKPRCPVAPVSTSGTAMAEVEHLITPPIQPVSLRLPSKIKAFIEDIRRIPGDIKCVVFSTWRLTLDLIVRGLEEEGIKSVRFDGKVPQKDRQAVVSSFNSDPNIRVILLTLSCGAVGLTLTAASRAYLMEPHWNPTLEEQALARIHRLGQSREVETVRFYMRDSFEEQVMKMQESKRQLAGVLLSPHDREKSNVSVGMLEKLRSLL
ncbi:SNF2 family N-terminal domain-containing protein [Nemania sp. FL0031]|nr:SNF2 family N-terminal domain-containing protein [Nemania sp. FL0031]